jgi:SAM-dependent methyltransferase
MAFAELKKRQSLMWGNGPYERITNTIRDIHRVVVERLESRPGQQWLDAACGTGAVAFLAAERGADVTGVDLAPALIETAAELAAEHGVEVRFDVGDCEELPYEDARFDAISSTCGVMFAPDHAAVAGELARVAKPGGRLALACWTPDGGVGDLFRMMAPFLPPPPEGPAARSSGGSESTSRSSSATPSSSRSSTSTRHCCSTPARRTGSSSRPPTARRRPQPRPSTTSGAPPSVRRGSTGPAGTRKGTASSTIASTC